MAKSGCKFSPTLIGPREGEAPAELPGGLSRGRGSRRASGRGGSAGALPSRCCRVEPGSSSRNLVCPCPASPRTRSRAILPTSNIDGSRRLSRVFSRPWGNSTASPSQARGPRRRGLDTPQAPGDVGGNETPRRSPPHHAATLEVARSFPRSHGPRGYAVCDAPRLPGRAGRVHGRRGRGASRTAFPRGAWERGIADGWSSPRSLVEIHDKPPIPARISRPVQKIRPMGSFRERDRPPFVGNRLDLVFYFDRIQIIEGCLAHFRELADDGATAEPAPDRRRAGDLEGSLGRRAVGARGDPNRVEPRARRGDDHRGHHADGDVAKGAGRARRRPARLRLVGEGRPRRDGLGAGPHGWWTGPSTARPGGWWPT